MTSKNTEIETEFSATQSLQGAGYTAARSRLLHHPAELSNHLKTALKSNDGNTYFTAKILSGWLDHAGFYEGVLAELDSRELRSRVAQSLPRASNLSPIILEYAAKAKNNYGSKIAPLCWEVLLKAPTQMEHWQRGICLAMLNAVPQVEDIKPAISLIATTQEPEAIGMLSNYLQKMPPKPLIAGLTPEIDSLKKQIETSSNPEPLVRTRAALQTLLVDAQERKESGR